MSLSLLLRTPRWLLFLLALGLFYFYSGGGPNQGSRFNLDRALLEEGRVTTNSYYTNSEDRAFYRGNYYCDKAPGTSFTALPTLAATRVLLRFVGVPPESANGLSVQYHVATWTAATLPALFMCWLMYAWVIRAGYSRFAAAYASLALGLASPIWAYGTLFWGNALAAMCLVFATRAILDLRRARRTKHLSLAAASAGLVAGWAVLTEFPLAPMAVTLFLLLLVWLRPWSVHWRRLVWFAIGALAAAALLGAYHRAAFGSPFRFGYGNVDGFDGMKHGLFGVRWPQPAAIAGVLWGPRGLLLTAPLLLFGLAGHVMAIVRGRGRQATVLCLGFCVYPFLLNVSYTYWDGGWTYGPRHMSSALPFLALGLAPLFDGLPRWARFPAVIALLLGIFLTMICVATHGMTPYSPANPFPDLYWPAFLDGRYVQHTGWPDAGGPATNWGLALGLGKAYSLVPLWIGMAIGIAGLARDLVTSPRDWRAR